MEYQRISAEDENIRGPSAASASCRRQFRESLGRIMLWRVPRAAVKLVALACPCPRLRYFAPSGHFLDACRAPSADIDNGAANGPVPPP